MQNSIIEEEFRADALANGVVLPKNIIANTPKPQRAGAVAYKLNLDGRPAGFYQDHKQGIKRTWKYQKSSIHYTQAEREAFKAVIEQNKAIAKQKLENIQAKAANKARLMFGKASPAQPNNSYLERKNADAHGTREWQGAIDDVLIIPLLDENLKIVNLQLIFKDGKKRFLSNGRKSGCFFPIGKKAEQGGKLIICEGFATGASIHQATGFQVICAMDAGNLKPVAELIRFKRPDIQIIIASDNDQSGVGQRYAQEAATAVNGTCVVCPVVGMDFNDLANSGGSISEVLG